MSTFVSESLKAEIDLRKIFKEEKYQDKMYLFYRHSNEIIKNKHQSQS